jgi:hypothetical protein
MSKRGEADPCDRPQKIYGGTLQNLHRASNVEADSSNRPKLSSPSILPGFNAMGNRVTSANKLEEVHTGPNQADVRIKYLGSSQSRFQQLPGRIGSGGT